MIIFEWENSVIETARTWPTSGPVYEFFNFWSDYHESEWVVLVFIIFCIYKFGWRKLIMPIMCSAVAVLLGDLISRRIVKVLVFRPRPNFIENICNTGKCLGFVSGHATNVSAVAMFLCLYDKRNIYWTLPCVLLVSFSRIYLIDHFPLDVIGGIILGSVIGAFIWWVFKTFIQKINFLKEITK